jgi:hypothetical protein
MLLDVVTCCHRKKLLMGKKQNAFNDVRVNATYNGSLL